MHIITFLYCSLSVKVEKFAELGKNSDKARSYHKLLLKLSSKHKTYTAHSGATLTHPYSPIYIYTNCYVLTTATFITLKD